MRVVGRFEIVERIVSGAAETYSARDPNSAQTVLLHLLEPNRSGSPEDRFRAYAPDCPVAVLESGTDPQTQRDFVVTEYPKDRTALLLWIRQLGMGAFRPKPAEPPASDGSTRVLDPPAIFAAVPRPPAPATPQPAPAQERSTRVLDASALASHLPPALGTPHPPAKPAEPAPPPPDEPKKPGAFTQAFAFPARKTSERQRIELPKTAPAPPAASGGQTREFSSGALANVLPPPPLKTGPPPKAAGAAPTPVRTTPAPAVLTPAPLKRAPAAPAPPPESKWSPTTLIALAAVALVVLALIVFMLMK